VTLLRKLFIQKDDGTYEELAAIIADRDLRVIKKTPIKKAIDKYLENCTANKCVKNQSTERLYFGIFQNFLNSKELTNIDEVTKEHIDQFESLLLKSMEASSVNRRFCAIKNFFNKCVEWSLIVESPCLKYRKRKVEQNPFKPWPPDLMEKFLLLTDGIWKKIFMFLWMTGCRPMELKNLRWTDVDYDNQTLKLRCGKNAQISRNFPITNDIDKFLHDLQMNGSFVFTGPDKKPINNDNLYHYCKKRMVRLGLVGYTVYGIRHGFGTRLARQGVSAFYIAELMGHADLKTTRGYVHSDKKLLIDILNKAN
jgi:integrase/recombinase XerD